MNELTAADAVNNPVTGPIAILIFIGAHFVNYKFGQGTRWAYVALIAGIVASFLLYSSTWATWASDQIAGFIDSFNGVPSHIVMGLVFILAVIATIADVWSDPDYNQAAVWALLIGPVFAHGASGFTHGVGEVLYGGMTIVVQGIITWLLGSL